MRIIKKPEPKQSVQGGIGSVLPPEFAGDPAHSADTCVSSPDNGGTAGRHYLRCALSIRGSEAASPVRSRRLAPAVFSLRFAVKGTPLRHCIWISLFIKMLAVFYRKVKYNSTL